LEEWSFATKLQPLAGRTLHERAGVVKLGVGWSGWPMRTVRESPGFG
jgi:hypothetical protein